MSTEPNITEQLVGQVSILAHSRNSTNKAKVLISLIENKIAATDAGRLLATARARLKELQAAEALAEKATRALAETAHAITNEKKPHPAVKLKSYTVLHYEPGLAFAYCLEHLPGALKFNKSPFEKVAKVADLDFVAISTEMRPTIDKDLSAYAE